MTRIDGVPNRKAGPLVRLVYRLSRRRLGREVDPIGVYAHAPGLLIGYGMLEQATAKQHRIDKRLKMLAELKAGALGRDAGITEQQLLALPHYRDSAEFGPVEKLVLDYAAAMSRTPAKVTDELFAAMREQFDERQLVELTSVIALENMRARFNCAFDMTPAGFSEGMVCVLPEESREAMAEATYPSSREDFRAALS
jgi:hypothetical protein